MLNKTLEIENAHIIFKNFAGEESRYNRAGSRNFCVIIENAEEAQALSDDGWNVRILVPRDEGDEPTYYLPVEVSFRNIPPKIIMLTGNKRNIIDEETVNQLDYVDIQNVDLVIRPYNWKIEEKSGVKTGVKAYLKSMYLTQEVDRFSAKYESVNDNDYEPPYK